MYKEFKFDFGLVTVKDRETLGETVRSLYVDDGFESACFTAPGKRNELLFEYMHIFADIACAAHGIKNTLLMGGGGFSFPKYYISRFPDKSLDVLELHGEIYDIAKKYFFLDELYKEYDLDRTGRLNVIIGDAYGHLKTCGKKYGLILNDTYNGREAADGMYLKKTIPDVVNCLESGGVYAVNVFCKGDLPQKKALHMQKALEEQFESVKLILRGKAPGTDTLRNGVIMAKDPLIYKKKL